MVDALLAAIDTFGIREATVLWRPLPEVRAVRDLLFRTAPRGIQAADR